MKPLLKQAIIVYFTFLIAYCAISGSRLLHQSSDIHFNYLADMWLHRRLDLGHLPPQPSNDWAEVEYLQLKDGRTVAGTFLHAQPFRFHELGGKVETIQQNDIASRFKKYYVSFPPFPAMIFLPFVALFGLGFNDVLLTVILAALAPTLLFVVLRKLAARGDSTRSETDDLWLTAMFGFGTVYLYSSILGQVWYTAHVVVMVLTGLFVLASLNARYPILAGLCLGAIFLTRPHVACWGLFFLYEAWRSSAPASDGSAAEGARRDWRARIPWGKLARVSIPVAILGAMGLAFNWVRFHDIGEFGHFYLNVRWTDRIQRYGLTNFSFLARNLTCAFTLTPRLINKPPYVLMSWHGMSMLITTPALLYLLWPRVKTDLHRVLWIMVLPIALAGFLYQNDGWVQFGYRFSNDFLFALMMLLAVGGRPLTRTFKTLIIIGIAINLFGAITFGRMNQFYFDGFFPISPGEL
jgi:hypothetical protein